jgi:hypothetical protein
MQATIQAEGEKSLKAMFGEMFEKYPAITEVRWTQYTPHFNDGDECRFGVHDPEFDIDGAGEGLSSWDIRYQIEDKKTLDPKFMVYKDAMSAVSSAVFGDHAQITVTREKISSREYDHD